MGWIRDDGQGWSYDHEGYIVAVVRDNGRWRDLDERDRERDTLFMSVSGETARHDLMNRGHELERERWVARLRGAVHA